MEIVHQLTGKMKCGVIAGIPNDLCSPLQRCLRSRYLHSAGPLTEPPSKYVFIMSIVISNCNLHILSTLSSWWSFRWNRLFYYGIDIDLLYFCIISSKPNWGALHRSDQQTSQNRILRCNISRCCNVEISIVIKMQQVQFETSMKNIPLGGKKEYVMQYLIVIPYSFYPQ